MWSSLKEKLTWPMGLALLALVAWGAGFTVRRILEVDALAAFRLGNDAPTGVTLGATDLSVYEGSKFVFSAKATGIQLANDRSSFRLQNITNGILASGKEKYKFTAPSALYQSYSNRLSVAKGARIWGKDLDIQTPAMVYNQISQRLDAPGKITGKVGGGQVTSQGLAYNIEKGSFKMGPTVWVGMIAAGQEPTARRPWTISSEDSSSGGGGLNIYLQARATDGEIIVKADRIEHNTKTDILVATGNVRYWGKDVNLRSPKVTVYRKEQRILAQNGVNMLIKAESDQTLKEEEIPKLASISPDQVKVGEPSPLTPEQEKQIEEVRSTKNIRDYPVTVLAEEAEYFWKEGSRRGRMIGSPQARQELAGSQWRMVWAHSADYDGEKDLLTLLSQPSLKDARLRASSGDDFKAVMFQISTKKDDDTWKGSKVEGVTYAKDDELPKAKTPPPAP